MFSSSCFLWEQLLAIVLRTTSLSCADCSSVTLCCGLWDVCFNVLRPPSPAILITTVTTLLLCRQRCRRVHSWLGLFGGLGVILWVPHLWLCEEKAEERADVPPLLKRPVEIEVIDMLQRRTRICPDGKPAYRGTCRSTYLESQWCCWWVSYSNGGRIPQRRKNNRLEWLCTGGEALVEVRWERKKGIKLRMINGGSLMASLDLKEQGNIK